MTHRRIIGSIILLLSVALAAPQVQGQLPVVRIGIVTDGYWERNDEVRELFQQEILELTRYGRDGEIPL